MLFRSVGFFHTCGIGGSDLGYCWGSSQWGQLGDNSAGIIRTEPTRISHDLRQGIDLPTFEPLSLYWIEASALGTCALSEGVLDGATYFPTGSNAPGPIVCWGLNNGNVFGQPAWNASLVPNTALTTLDPITTKLSLYNASACAMSEGDAYCWGGSGLGETGDGTTQYRPEPTRVQGPAFTSVSAGSGHSCGVTAGGQAYCWGANHRGQLGTGNLTSSLVPVAVASGVRFKEIYAAGANPFFAFTCAITVQGEAYCWGGNEVGQLGDGTTNDRLIPTRVIEPI